MPRTNLKILDFQARPQTPRYLYASALPLPAQAKLSEIMQRFDRVMKERPAVAERILWYAEQILQMFNA